jgi:hypothetical protein
MHFDGVLSQQQRRRRGRQGSKSKELFLGWVMASRSVNMPRQEHGKTWLLSHSCTCEGLSYQLVPAFVQQVERTFTVHEIEAYGNLIQDKNILHFPSAKWDDLLNEMPHLNAVKESGLIRFRDPSCQHMKPLVHGIFLSTLFSSIFSTLSPGCVYIKQTLSFSNPVYADDRVVARIQIEKINRWRKGGLVLQCQTTVSVHDDDENSTTAISGAATVWLPSAHQQDTL